MWAKQMNNYESNKNNQNSSVNPWWSNIVTTTCCICWQKCAKHNYIPQSEKLALITDLILKQVQATSIFWARNVMWNKCAIFPI